MQVANQTLFYLTMPRSISIIDHKVSQAEFFLERMSSIQIQEPLIQMLGKEII